MRNIRRPKKNMIIRTAAAEKGLYAYEVAELLEISLDTYMRHMRKEMPVEEQHRIAKLIYDAEIGDM
jgi:hypothetical protein